MSAQGATIKRGTAHLPIWPVAGLVAIAAVALVITSVMGGFERSGGNAAPSVQTVAVNPGMWTLAQAEAYLNELESLEVANPGMWTLSQAQAYLDGLQVSTHPTGLENPTAYPDVRTSDGPTPGTRPGMRDGQICGQCR